MYANMRNSLDWNRNASLKTRQLEWDKIYLDGGEAFGVYGVQSCVLTHMKKTATAVPEEKKHR